METINRTKHPDIIDRILNNGSEFEFHQIMNIFGQLSYPSYKSNSKYIDYLRLRPAAEISFPAADIRRCNLTSNNMFDLQINFMGLYGVDSPLPHYFLENISLESEVSEIMRDFIDMFCHRYYFQFHLVWEKYHPFINFESSDFICYLNSLSGNGRSDNIKTDLLFSPVMGMRVKNAACLSKVLSSYLDDVNVEVQQFSPRWISISSETALGQVNSDSPVLGDNIILGDSILDLSGKIDVCIGPISVELSSEILPGSDRLYNFTQLIEKYLEPSITYDLVIKIVATNKVNNNLGSSDIVLGWSCWIGKSFTSNTELRISKESITNVTDIVKSYNSNSFDYVA